MPPGLGRCPAQLSQSIRQDPLPIVGPSGNDVAPNFSMFLSRLFDEKNGAFPLLGATLGGTRFPTSEPLRSQQGDLGGGFMSASLM